MIFNALFKWIDSKIHPVPPKKYVLKMYVLVREDLPPIHRAVQAGHAVASYFMKLIAFRSNVSEALIVSTPDKMEVHRWDNGVMIYLAVKNEYELLQWQLKLVNDGVTVAMFTEPDWGAPTNTALACISFGEEFSELPLLNMNHTEPLPELKIPECMHKPIFG